MKVDLDPRAVAERLAELRRLYVPETVDDARKRLTREAPPRAPEAFATAVARRLAELRALDELARHLHRRR